MGFAKNRALEFEDRRFGDVEGSICFKHVTDTSLARRLEEFATEHTCVVCGRVGDPETEPPFAVPLEELMYVVMETLHHFYSDADAVLPWDSEDHVLVGTQLETWEVVDDVVGGAFDEGYNDQINDLVTEAIGYQVTWTPWLTDAATDGLEYAWEEFAEVAKFQSRMVVGLGEPTDPPARLANFLDRVLMYASAELGLVMPLAAGTPLYRGRLCENPRSLMRHSDDLGPAPSGKAAANRMSPAGVALFYASADPQTALAEIAGHGVEPMAVIGRFTNTRELRILDLTAKPPQISPFNLEHREHARMGRFLSTFVANITTPVIPDGRQHVEYAPTQLLTEYLRWVPKPRLDGIALPSAQTTERTYVLFFGRADCSTLDGPAVAEHPASFAADDAEGPTLVLDPEAVVTYRIERRYAGFDAGPSYRAAPPSSMATEHGL
ncbi:RES domain-containing protein [Promicromonospora sp. NPDC052451]|uniref:RES domain-containing protein n=1 Tax=Promicromonospora sp. NPDC052451 TaxID=3364407 RepID=UPI0037C564AE